MREMVENWTLRNTGSFKDSGNALLTSLDPSVCEKVFDKLAVPRNFLSLAEGFPHTSLVSASKNVREEWPVISQMNRLWIWI